jgi:CheY-like chemotaxis protein
VTNRERLLLRAELTVGATTTVTHTVEVSPTQIQIACPVQVAIGEEVSLALSFPGLVPRVELRCRVTSLHPPDGHGRPASVTCDIIGASAEDRARLAKVGGATDGALRQYRCLLVEDNQFIVDLFTYGVHRYGAARRRAVAMSVAKDAEEAWQMLEGDAYDMAIVDHYLPVESGADLIAKIRKSPRLSSMSVVAISVGGSEVREATMSAGADLFLDKPIVMRDLFETLDKLAIEVCR